MRHTNLYCSTCRKTNVFFDRVTFFECQACKKQLIIKALFPLATLDQRLDLSDDTRERV